MPTLFLLHPNFEDPRVSPDQKFYCPHCAMIEGIIKYYPELKNLLEIKYVNFKRPRREIVALVGEENQGCPNLILHKSELEGVKVDLSDFEEYGAFVFSNSKYAIAKFLSDRYGLPRFHP